MCLPLYVEVDRIYNLACPASPIHDQNDPIATTKTSVVGAINMLGLAKRRHARILQASTSAVAGNQVTFTASAGGVVTALTDSGTGASGAAIAVTTPGANTTAIAGTLETLTGGTGHDTFSFNTPDVNTTGGVVTAIITDFKTGEDKIKVTMSGTNYVGSVDTFVKGGIFNSLADLLTAANTAITGLKMYYVAQFGTDSYLVTDNAGGNGHGYTNVIKLANVAVAEGIVETDLIGISVFV